MSINLPEKQGTIAKRGRNVNVVPEREGLRLYCYEDGKLHHEILIDRVEIAHRIWEWLNPPPTI